jgi:hypothetical protein
MVALQTWVAVQQWRWKERFLSLESRVPRLEENSQAMNLWAEWLAQHQSSVEGIPATATPPQQPESPQPPNPK